MEELSQAALSQGGTPDLSRLASWSQSRWRAFGDRLHAIGLNDDNLEPLDTVLPNALPRLSVPLKRWLLRQRDCDFNFAARLLMLGDAITRDQAESAFGAELLQALIDAGMFDERPNRTLLSRFRLHIGKGFYILCDDLRVGAGAVMGLGGTTLGLLDAVHGENLGRVLDLGCGAGAIALALSRSAETVVATDINPRALVFGKINSAINGVENVEFREGDLYEPVEDDVFNLIVSQPPFIPMPEGSAPATYLFGGARGDELPLRAMAGAADHLCDGGRAVILVQWPEVDGDPLSDRVRRALPARDVDLLLVTFPSLSVETLCLAYSSFTHVELGERFEADLVRWREHFARLNIGSMRHCLNILRKNSNGRGWTKEVFPSTGLATPRSINSLFARYDLLSADDQTQLAAKLVTREDAVVESETSLRSGRKKKLRISFTGKGMNRPAEVNQEMVRLIRAVHRAPSVGAGIASYAGEGESEADTLSAVKEALELGLLEVATPKTQG